MKHGKPLRRTELKRSQKPLKRGRLKRKPQCDSPMVAQYRKDFPLCQYCNREAASDIHELFSAGRRLVARAHRSCILHLCRRHHRQLQGAEPALQLAVKAWGDPKGFDLLEYNRLTPGKRPTMKEVDKYLTPMRMND